MPTTACSYGPGSDGPGGDGGDNGDGGPGGAVPDKNDCATYELIPERITEALTLDGCYEAKESVEVSAALTIQPGSVLLFSENTELRAVKNGSINAVGTAERGILIAGTRSVAGIWDGIRFHDSDRFDNQLSYVTVQDGGKLGEAAVTLSTRSASASVKIDHTTVENSAGFGLKASGDSTLPEFSNNTFKNNANGPVSVIPDLVGALDASSRYSGNGVDLIEITATRAPLSGEATWLNLDVPYHVADADLLIAADLTIEAGAEFQFANDLELIIREAGTLAAEGIDTNRIVFKAAKAVWKGITFNQSDSSNNQLSYVTIEGANSRAGGNKAALELYWYTVRAQVGLKSVVIDVPSGAIAIQLSKNTTLSSCEDVQLDRDQIAGHPDAVPAAIDECGL